ncbi:MAG: hypothetical protein ACMG6E_00165 [Candidatus Roizmanbacteria bacterium]
MYTNINHQIEMSNEMNHDRPLLFEVYLRDVGDPPGMMYKAITLQTELEILAYAHMFRRQHKIAEIRVISSFKKVVYHWVREV